MRPRARRMIPCGGDKPPPVIFPSRKLYTETNQIWFENINSIYLREEMRCWVRGGAAALSTTETKHLLVVGLCSHLTSTKSTFLTPRQTFILCTFAAQVWQNVSKRQKEWGGGGGGKRKCWGSQRRNLTSVWTTAPKNKAWACDLWNN